jgi:anthranilate phosphoribosyltransferase
MNIPEVLEKILSKQNLSVEEAKELATAIIKGELNEAQTAGILVALRAKGETPEEIAGFALAMREAALKVGPWEDALDTAGTGGDRMGTFNASTATALLASKIVRVAKHGNRGVSSKSGSADFLEALGYNISVKPEEAERIVKESNFVFLFAQLYHPAMKNVAPVRKALGIRTVFNVLGPLTNPANVKHQVIGVFSKGFMAQMAQALTYLSPSKVMLVHGEPGIDEVSVSGITHAVLIKGGSIEELKIDLESLRIREPIPIQRLVVSDPDDSVVRFLRAIKSKDEYIRSFVKANLAVATFVASKAKSIEDGVELADQVINEGLETITRVVSTHGDVSKLKKLVEAV